MLLIINTKAGHVIKEGVVEAAREEAGLPESGGLWWGSSLQAAQGDGNNPCVSLCPSCPAREAA